MKELIFLPDRDGRDEIGDAQGFVRVGTSADALAQLASRLVSPHVPQEEAAADTLAWRSALTLALLADAWPDCGSTLQVLTIREDTSAFASWVLASRPEAERNQPVHLLLLERGETRLLLGMADAKTGVRLPAQRVSLAPVMPERAAWFDAQTGRLSDPIPYLNEGERELLLRRMEALELADPLAEDYMEALRSADEAEEEAVRMQEEAALTRLAVRLEAVCGLKDFEAFSVREESLTPGENPLMACLGCALKDVGTAQDGCTYLWQGVPFARTSRALGLTGTMHPGEAVALEKITGELTMMSSSSVKWNYETGMALQRWLEGQGPNALLLSQARTRIEESCALLLENGRQVQSTVTLRWPWDASCGAVRALLLEALGEGWLEAAANPFSDRLTRLTGHVLGDTALSTCCACADGVLLPPLSRAMAACAAQEGMEGGLALDAMRFTPLEDGGVEASFLLRGKGEVRMVRVYAPEETAVLEAGENLCVAVWPCLPMENWRAYYVFMRGNVEVAATCGDGWRSCALPEEGTEENTWRTLPVDSYPGCLSLAQDGLCLGALPNMLPLCKPEKRGNAVIGVDMGSSRTAVVFAFGGVPALMEGQQLTRLLVSPAGMEADDFLCSLTPASVVPTAAVLTGGGDTLFVDGYALRPASLQALAQMDSVTLRARLKWRSDPDCVRARRLLLHQVMLGAALTAASAGATSVAWRATIADDMGDEGREAMLEAMSELVEQVSQESGLPLTDGVPALTWAEESAALCACLRGEGSAQGSCVSVDLGSGSTKMQLWLLNQGKPAAGEVVFEGVQDVLLRFYRRTPVRLLEDLADCGDEALLADVLTLVDQLNPDLTGPRQLDKLHLMLDMLLDVHRTAIGQHVVARSAAGRPTYLQSLLLETTAAALYCVGLMLAQAGDNAMISHMLPQDASVFLTGRGAWLLETLSPAGRNALQHLTHLPMRLDHPTRFITLRAAARQAESVALGLTVTRETGHIADAPLIRTRESFSMLMQRLMQQMCTAFPGQMWLLHEGLYDWQSGALTQAGMDSIRRACARCYDAEEDFAATVAAFLRTLRENPILPDGMGENGA